MHQLWKTHFIGDENPIRYYFLKLLIMAKDKEFEKQYKLERQRRMTIRKQRRIEKLDSNRLCPSCKRNHKSTYKHTCPYAEEMSDDHFTKCTCCSDCEHECAMDI